MQGIYAHTPLTNMEYWKEHYLDVYIQDATAQMLEASNSRGRKNQRDRDQAPQYLLQYFQSVQSGGHIMGRPYSYVSATPHNRKSFIKLVWLGLRGIQGETGTSGMRGEHYHQLLQLFCPDFPISLVEETMAVIGCKSREEEGREECAGFVEFLYTLQILFYYQEFLSGCASPMSPSTGPVVIVPAEMGADGGDATEDTGIEEGAYIKETRSLIQSVRSYHTQLINDKIPVPPIPLVEQALEESEGLPNYIEVFKRKLCSTKTLSDIIGILPSRESISHTTDTPNN